VAFEDLLCGWGAVVDQVVLSGESGHVGRQRDEVDLVERDGVLNACEVRHHEVSDHTVKARDREGPERCDVAQRRVVTLAELHELEKEVAAEIFSVSLREPREPLVDQGFRKREMVLNGAVRIVGGCSVHAGL